MAGPAGKTKKKPLRLRGFLAYFEGYSEVKIPRKNGKGFRIERIYTEPYWIHDQTDEAWINQKRILAGLTAFSLCMFVWAALTPVATNREMSVAAPCGLSTLGELFLLVQSIEYLSCPRKMTIYQYRHGSKQLKLWSALTTLWLIITAVMSAVTLFLIEEPSAAGVLFCTLKYLLSAFASGFICYMERKTEYCEAENDTKLPFFPDISF